MKLVVCQKQCVGGAATAEIITSQMLTIHVGIQEAEAVLQVQSLLISFSTMLNAFQTFPHNDG